MLRQSVLIEDLGERDWLTRVDAGKSTVRRPSGIVKKAIGRLGCVPRFASRANPVVWRNSRSLPKVSRCSPGDPEKLSTPIVDHQVSLLPRHSLSAFAQLIAQSLQRGLERCLRLARSSGAKNFTENDRDKHMESIAQHMFSSSTAPCQQQRTHMDLTTNSSKREAPDSSPSGSAGYIQRKVQCLNPPELARVDRPGEQAVSQEREDEQEMFRDSQDKEEGENEAVVLRSGCDMKHLRPGTVPRATLQAVAKKIPWRRK